ncbi:MAG: CHAT domain-containing protein [Vicinamibacterales bacterium]
MLADALLNPAPPAPRPATTPAARLPSRRRWLRETSSPDSIGIASLLASLASNAEAVGDLERATTLAARAVAHVDRVAPESLVAAQVRHVAGREALARGDAAPARRLHEASLANAQAVAPGSRAVVTALVALAALDARQQRLASAADRYGDALSLLTAQVRRLGAALEAEAAYVDDAHVERPYVDVLLALDRDREALETVERVRARAVLDRLAARDLTFGRTDEAATLARERRNLASAYDAALSQLAALEPDATPDTVRQLQARLGDLRDRQALTASNLRRADPALAEALDPAPPSLPALRAALPPDTLALVYHLGADRPAVFAVTRDRQRVAALGASAAVIQERVGAWRRLVDRGRTSPPAAADLDAVAAADLDAVAAELYRALLAPVDRELRAAAHVVIVPDGVLHGLAFAALRRPAPEGGYVADWKPTTVAPSLSALARLAARPPRPVAARRAVVLGDPSFAGGAAAGPGDAALRQAVVGGLAPIPGSRREAERIAETFGATATLLLGDRATEQAVKAIARDTSVLHIASHGVVNQLSPLDSAIVLAAPEGGSPGDNGLLQAWEIFDQVRIDADLVVLSACETSLGRTFEGEGLLGLTRAFQFAGARAVVASLWKAPDAATAELMERFYRELAAGRPPADALTRAQRWLAARPDTAHPFFWAGFVLDGDGQ